MGSAEQPGCSCHQPGCISRSEYFLDVVLHAVCGCAGGAVLIVGFVQECPPIEKFNNDDGEDHWHERWCRWCSLCIVVSSAPVPSASALLF